MLRRITGPGGETGGTIKSSRRTLEILELFAETHEPVTEAEVAHRLGYPQSSTSMLLLSLVQLGYLEKVDRLFRPTLRVMLLGAWLQDRLIGQGSLLRRMDGLRTRTGLTVLIGMQQATRVRYILALRREGTGENEPHAGMARPIFRTGLGKALLLPMPDAAVARLLRRANAEETDPRLRIPQAAFLEDIRQSRERGWATGNASVQKGVGVIGMMLPALPAQPPLSIGLGGALDDIQARQEEIVGELREVCCSLSPSKY
ncbi:IclR family transcriptional regulator [Roseomonas xinghualingensis]|uniref:IclR family transcriptional regulator n=1 Tax=Roseomonas xinghualingensis TaxID=2986475 RepID=UPI0021F1C6D7|nr:helix-turn-helix domain-containing protein [Roseomonas sp. SXEYE001]MCV4210117.1 helix-turn-helix domain-containing protein [Roseomonas sp. SXEYE001]